MIELRPYDDLAANAVLSFLDPSDHLEAEITRGEATTGLALFADWRAMNGARLLSLVLCTGRKGATRPFAVLGLSHSGAAGVAHAAMLARSHARNRIALARAAVMIRAGLPVFCAEEGIRRIEARCWADHPTAPAFLDGCGFTCECVLPSYGREGTETFLQFAWTASSQHHQEDF